MRKVILLLAIVFGFIACEGPVGPPGEGTNWKILTYEVLENHWVLDGGEDVLGSFYFYEFNESELTSYIYRSGIVQAQLVLNPGQSNERLIPLNRSLPNYDVYDDGYETYTEHYEFEYGVGKIAFYFYDSDYITSVPPPYTKFRVVMNY